MQGGCAAAEAAAAAASAPSPSASSTAGVGGGLVALAPAAVQALAEQFAQLFYGLLAVRPSGLRDFYREGSQARRVWPRNGAGHDGQLRVGLAAIMEVIMAAVGGSDPTPEMLPCVATSIEAVQASVMAGGSGLSVRITGYITFLRQDAGAVFRFVQDVVLRPCAVKADFLYVHEDVVEYIDPASVSAHSAQVPPLPSPVQDAPPAASQDGDVLQVLLEVPPAAAADAVQAAAAAAEVPEGGAAAPPAAAFEAAQTAKTATPPRAAQPAAAGGSWAAIAARSKAAVVAAPAPAASAKEEAAAPAAARPAEAAGAAAAAGGGKGDGRVVVKLCILNIPIEETKDFKPPLVSGAEVLEVLNRTLKELLPNHAGVVIEVDRKDERKPYSFASCDPLTAKELVQLSRERKVYLRGERLVLEPSNYNSAGAEDAYYASGGGARRSYWHEGGRGGKGKGKKGYGGTGGDGDSGWSHRDRSGSGGHWRSR